MSGILFVDDEIQILSSLKRLFIDTDYDIYTADSGIEALKILENEDISLIISDMRMPIMDGYQLLSKVKETYPQVLRVILSGYSDEKVIFNALQQNVAKLYMFKPWENEKLLNLVDQIFETEKTLNDSDLLILVNSIEELPTIKSSYSRIIGMIENDEDIVEISKEIERDPSISTKLLHIINSAFYGIQTGSVNKAVTFLGLQSIRSLIQATSIMNSMTISEDGEDYVETLWSHAFMTNKILKYIYQNCINKKLPDVASSAGLLHNIGVVFILKYYYDHYITLRKEAENDKIDMLTLEKKIYKVTHQETGGYLLKWWDLPFPIVEAALYHHNPFDPRIINTELVAAVHIAQKYAADTIKMPQLTEFYPKAFEIININEEEFEVSFSKEIWN